MAILCFLNILPFETCTHAQIHTHAQSHTHTVLCYVKFILSNKIIKYSMHFHKIASCVVAAFVESTYACVDTGYSNLNVGINWTQAKYGMQSTNVLQPPIDRTTVRPANHAVAIGVNFTGKTANYYRFWLYSRVQGIELLSLVCVWLVLLPFFSVYEKREVFVIEYW